VIPAADQRPELATAQQVAVTWLRRAIASGRLRPGDRVGQEAVAADIGVSLIPVREALRILESEGLVTYLPRRGYHVTELDLRDLEEIYRLRRLLETDAVRRRLEDGGIDLAALQAAADDCRAAVAAGDVDAGLAANRRLHFGLFGLAAGEPQERLIRMLWDATEAYRALYYDLPGGSEAADDAHVAIIAAATAGDGDALLDELDRHRDRALQALREALAG
jgi:DNA-binding GntR family transcriptional regulator